MKSDDIDLRQRIAAAERERVKAETRAETAEALVEAMREQIATIERQAKAATEFHSAAIDENRQLRRRLDLETDQHLNQRQSAVLGIIDRNLRDDPPASINYTTIGEEIGISKACVYRTVNRLVDFGCIEMKPGCPWSIRLTPRGRAALLRANAATKP